MLYEERRPRPELRPHLECLWLVSDSSRRTRRAPDRVLPDGCPELIVHLADPFCRRIDGRWVVQPRAFLAGTLSRPWLLRAGPRVLTLGLRFRPGAVTDLLPLSMAAARDRELALREIVGAEPAEALLTRLRGRQTREQRFAAAELWLLERRTLAPAGRTSTRRPNARRAVGLILRAHGDARIAAVAAELGWSRRRLERAFEHDVGLPPKLFARIVRLNAVLARLDATERARAIELALDAGYFDQAHLLKDFRSLAGRTPRAGREADGRLARHFTRADRLRLMLQGG